MLSPTQTHAINRIFSDLDPLADARSYLAYCQAEVERARSEARKSGSMAPITEAMALLAEAEQHLVELEAK